MTETLEPIDANQCQAEKREGSFMSFGLPRLVRCEEEPTWVCVSVREGVFYGAMSLCDVCKKTCETQMPDVSFQRMTCFKQQTVGFLKGGE